jgi:hypothetical protein
MPAVEAIETNLHYLFARNRVMGEWMQFTDSELQTAIAKAKDLAAEMSNNIEDFKRAEALKDQISNGQVIPASEEATELYGTIQDLKEVLDSCDSALEKYDDYLYEAIELGIDVSGKAKIQERAGARKFDEKLFAATYPDIYKKYTISTFPVRGSFRLKAAKEWAIDFSAINQDQVELLAQFTETLDEADHSMDTGFTLHELHLGVLEIKKYAEWNIDIANVKLRVNTGEAEGIEGICTWKREAKEVVTFDKQGLQSNHPDENQACVVQAAGTKALIVEPKAAGN